MIKFITSESPERKTFGDVANDQFFLNRGGALCQKVSSLGFNTITDAQGNPCADTDTAEAGDLIERILPYVSKIEF